MNNLGGVFVFLIGGLALALLIALIEFLINAFVNSKADKVSYLLSHSDSTTPMFVLVFVIFHGIVRYDAYHEKKNSPRTLDEASWLYMGHFNFFVPLL